MMLPKEIGKSIVNKAHSELVSLCRVTTAIHVKRNYQWINYLSNTIIHKKTKEDKIIIVIKLWNMYY